MMGGTLLLLGEAGWQLHYMNVANGNLGSMVLPAARTAALRKREAQAAAKELGATWHPPICNDLGIFYDDSHAAPNAPRSYAKLSRRSF